MAMEWWMCPTFWLSSTIGIDAARARPHVYASGLKQGQAIPAAICDQEQFVNHHRCNSL